MVVSFGLGMMGQPEKGFLATLNGVSGCLDGAIGSLKPL